jgi:magnesium transporter
VQGVPARPAPSILGGPVSDRRLSLRALAPRPRRGRRAPVVPVERTAAADGPGRRSGLVDSAIYVDGKRVASPESLAETYTELRRNPDGMAWIGLYQPDEHVLASLASEFELHELSVEDAIVAHQRPKIERYDDTLFVVLHGAWYVDDLEEVRFGELHVFVGPDFVLTVRHGAAPDLTVVRRRMESDPDLLRQGPEAVLYAILDKVVDDYAPVVAGLENDVDEIETEVWSSDPSVSRRIYELSREVIEFQRAANPLILVLEALEAGFEKYAVDEELQRYLRDVADHLVAVVEPLDGFRQLLRDMLTVNATLVAQAQNEEMKQLTEATYAQNEEVKKVSAWAAILFAPTLIGTIYGMNFRNMPELGWEFGYEIALVLMVAICVTLYVVFKRRDWL